MFLPLVAIAILASVSHAFHLNHHYRKISEQRHFYFQPSTSTKTSTRIRASNFEFQDVLVPVTFALTTAALSYQVDRDSEFVSKMFKTIVRDETVFPTLELDTIAASEPVPEPVSVTVAPVVTAPEPVTAVAVKEEPVQVAAIVEESQEQETKSARPLGSRLGGLLRLLYAPWLPLVRPSLKTARLFQVFCIPWLGIVSPRFA